MSCSVRRPAGHLVEECHGREGRSFRRCDGGIPACLALMHGQPVEVAVDGPREIFVARDHDGRHPSRKLSATRIRLQ